MQTTLFIIMTLVAGAALAIGYLAGRASAAPAPKPAQPQAAPVDALALWDAHSSLNVLNRSALMHGNDEDPVYLVAAHLQSLALLHQSGGLARQAQVKQWLGALVDMHHFLHPSAAAASQGAARMIPHHRVTLPARVEQLQLAPLGAALVRMLRQCGPVQEVAIEVTSETLVSRRAAVVNGRSTASASCQVPVKIRVTPAKSSLALVVDTVTCEARLASAA